MVGQLWDIYWIWKELSISRKSFCLVFVKLNLRYFVGLNYEFYFLFISFILKYIVKSVNHLAVSCNVLFSTELSISPLKFLISDKAYWTPLTNSQDYSHSVPSFCWYFWLYSAKWLRINCLSILPLCFIIYCPFLLQNVFVVSLENNQSFLYFCLRNISRSCQKQVGGGSWRCPKKSIGRLSIKHIKTYREVHFQ